MCEENITPQKMVDRLNAFYETDPLAVLLLMTRRVPCKEALGGDHDSFQILRKEAGSGKFVFSASTLGLLNGFFDNKAGTICTETEQVEDDEGNTRTKLVFKLIEEEKGS